MSDADKLQRIEAEYYRRFGPLKPERVHSASHEPIEIPPLSESVKKGIADYYRFFGYPKPPGEIT